MSDLPLNCIDTQLRAFRGSIWHTAIWQTAIWQTENQERPAFSRLMLLCPLGVNRRAAVDAHR